MFDRICTSEGGKKKNRPTGEQTRGEKPRVSIKVGSKKERERGGTDFSACPSSRRKGGEETRGGKTFIPEGVTNKARARKGI